MGLPGERLAHDGVRGGRPGAVVLRVSRSGAGGRLVRAFHEYRDFALLQSSFGGCRRWSATSDTPPGYVARAWFRYGAVSPGQCVLRACSRAGVLPQRNRAEEAPVSCRVSPMDRGRPDRLDSRHSIQCP